MQRWPKLTKSTCAAGTPQWQEHCNGCNGCNGPFELTDFWRLNTLAPPRGGHSLQYRLRCLSPNGIVPGLWDERRQCVGSIVSELTDRGPHVDIIETCIGIATACRPLY
jgi:hypothetical protein